MFIDEMIEDLLIEKKMMYADAFPIVCKEKLQDEMTFDAIKRIENGYQLVVKRHSGKLNPSAFRRYVYLRSVELAKRLGWDKEFTVSREAGNK
jgi:hypothetical protein